MSFSGPTKIRSVEAKLFHVPLEEVLSDAKHGDHTFFELITVTVVLDNGLSGTGYTYTGGWGGRAILAMIQHDLAAMVVGRDGSNIEHLHDEMRWHIHYVGRGGVSAFAIAAIDIALWDIRGKMNGQSLTQMAGGASDRCKAYCGGIDLNFPLPKLLANIDGYLARGHNGVKIKVGREDLNEDIERVLAVREQIGPDIAFMVDANYGMDVQTAVQAAKLMEPANLVWFEEPIDPDDLEGYKTIEATSAIPLAAGENCHSVPDFELLSSTGSLGFVQPDAGTCGGVTTWLRAADIAERHGITVCSHGMQELHVSLLAGRPNSGWLEVHSFPIDKYTTRPLVVEDNLAVAPDLPGIGVAFYFYTVNAASGPLSNPLIRQAVSYAIDRDGIVAAALSGVGGVPAGTIYPEGKGWASDIPASYDPARAEALLAEAGAVKEGGIWMLDGAPLEIDIVTYSSRAALPPTAELTQAFLAAIGVKANITVGEWGASNDAIAAGEADLFLQAWVTTPQGDPGAVLETLLKSDGGSNSGNFSNERLDELLAQGRLTFDHAKRKAIYDEVQKIVAAEAALIPVFHVSQTNVGVPGLIGYQVHPTETYWITHETKLAE
ncbi:MAG: enolase C-terminal domain-like protein [Pseudomonadota bacterium]